MSDYKFEGWAALDKNSVKGQLKWQEYEPKKWDEEDVDIKILYCGVCASDLHVMRSGWGEVNYPQVVGHEIVGTVVKIGKNVKGIEVGDLVGVGAQSDSCRVCNPCTQHKEQHCVEGMVGTYASVYKRGAGKGDKTYGGYANYARVPAHFVIQIPKEIPPAMAAPMLCGGVTVFSPLKKYGAGTTAKDVGIVGIGGLGHFGVLFAKALGAKVTAISHSDSKKADAEQMGATRFIATGDGSTANFEPYARSLDLIICTVGVANMPLQGYFRLLRLGGTIVFVGLPEEPLPPMTLWPLIATNIHMTGSAIGSPQDINEMFEVAVKHSVRPWIEKIPLKNTNDAVVKMEEGKARYRFVLVNESNGGKTTDEE